MTTGNYRGKVKSIEDNSGQAHVLVDVQHADVWARICMPGGGKDRRGLCLPKIDDVVYVAFEGNGAGEAVLLGSFWASAQDVQRVGYADATYQSVGFLRQTGLEVRLDDSCTVNSKGGFDVLTDQDCYLDNSGHLLLAGNSKVAVGSLQDVEIAADSVNVTDDATSIKGWPMKFRSNKKENARIAELEERTAALERAFSETVGGLHRSGS